MDSNIEIDVLSTQMQNADGLENRRERIRQVYRADGCAWVVGYSGGKDSTACLQLIWEALRDLPIHERHKPVHVISTDTLVEQPLVAAWVNESLRKMQDAAEKQELPIRAHRLIPELKDRYWVNLLGKGYAFPRNGFRWCTDRLKIKPSNHFIQTVASRYGEAIVVLGTRKAESGARAANMEKYEKQRVREWLSPNGSLPNSWVFTPIEDWEQDDVWIYLMQNENPWGHSNKSLLTLYRGATDGGECPLVIESATPSCGSSRFGCFVCTLVSKDKSMAAMINNDPQNEWLIPLLELRDEIARTGMGGKAHDYAVRDFRRSDGSIKLFRNTGRPIPGPYTRARRHELLRRVLETQAALRELAPADMRDLEVVRMDELQEIRRIWVQEKYEWNDALPRIYEEVCHEPFPAQPLTTGDPEEWELLQSIVGDNEMEFELAYSLLGMTTQDSPFATRHGNRIDEIERIIRRCYYQDEDDAAAWAADQAGTRSGHADDERETLDDEQTPVRTVQAVQCQQLSFDWE